MYVWGMKNLETLNQTIQRIFIVYLEKSWNIESNETKSQHLICSYLWRGTWEYFNYLCIECATWQNLILSLSLSLSLSIYIYIYIDIDYIFIGKLALILGCLIEGPFGYTLLSVSLKSSSLSLCVC